MVGQKAGQVHLIEQEISLERFLGSYFIPVDQ